MRRQLGWLLGTENSNEMAPNESFLCFSGPSVYKLLSFCDSASLNLHCRV